MTYCKRFPVIIALAALLFPGVALAQLYGDFVPREPQPGNVYFGLVKNADGDYIEGATVVLKTSMVEYVAVSDVRGRFRVELPEAITPDQVETRCSRDGYTSARVTRRLPRGESLTPVEIGCHLQQ